MNRIVSPTARGLLAMALAVLLTVAVTTFVFATPSSLTREVESRVNRLNAFLPAPSGQNPPGPLPRFPQQKQNEPTIAVNPLNPLNLIAGANDEQAEPPCQDLNGDGALSGLAECPFAANVGSSGLYVSTNGGRTWTDLGVLDTVTTAAADGWATINQFSSGDPAIAFDSQGNAYYANLAIPKSPAAPQVEQGGLAANLVVAKATFDSSSGTTGLKPTDWVPVLVTDGNPVRFDDKENIWADTSSLSPFKDNVYVSWSTFTSNVRSIFGGIASDHIAIVRSEDGGASWSNPVHLSRSCNIGCGGVQGSVVRTGPSGEVYVAWEESLNRFAPNAIVFSKSLDGGIHFTRPSTGGAFRDATPKAGFRDNSFPSMTVAPDGTIYIAWAARCPAGPGCSRTKVLLAKSTNGGDSWSTPMLVSQRIATGTEDPGDQFFPWVTVSQDGPNTAVSIVFYDRSYDTTGLGSCTVACTVDNTRLIGVTVATSLNGGTSWDYARADTTSSGFDPAGSSTNGQGAQFMGDYIYAASAGDKVFVVWTDARNGFTGAGKSYAISGSYGDSDIFFARLSWTP
ncbi:MAG: exo-alpha-sialidase [Bacillati bacterium ANGP1]|uniref:Exo-alpha-sialidase n=1 Tax=Candidatus Segetimicrobium genomatis TaxID=2569760 RepID=A0A537L328_9BACT|nr:MAG: exo-alpha-sialidase [Terrabacteria group bacterium ANGP1]